MKNKIALASLAAALAACAGLASTAKADGGIRFGISFGDYGRPAYCAPVYTPPHCVVPEYPAYVQPGYGHQYYDSPDRGQGFYNGGYGANYCPPVVEHRPRGYWQDVTVKTWVPGQRVETHDQWGRHVCVEQPGYFVYRTERVWVSNRG